MTKKPARAAFASLLVAPVAAAMCVGLSSTAWASSDEHCAAEWKSADGNGDGELVGPEAERYLAYYRVRAQVEPVQGRIGREEFMRACRNDVFMAKAPDDGAPLKGANSFTEEQAKDRAKAAGYSSIASLKKDGDGVWRGNGMKDGKATDIAVDYKGNVVAQ
ncbi:PepSY domain-containing protein [Reyranella sp.]|uniref:PepSY domain-containing protein n=1 Tax=Reyranella sp. TaxID=1929291 RepID=UPI003BAB5128